MINIQQIATLVVIIGLGIGYYLYHVKPIKDLEKRITILEDLVNAKNTTINNLDSKLRKCQDEKKQQGFEEYVKGLSNEVNTTNHPRFTF